MICKVTETSHLVGKKWAIILLDEIHRGNFEGFNVFMRKSCNKITPRGLSMELKSLEGGGGLIKKLNNNNVSAYELTQKGAELHKIIMEIKAWNTRWNDANHSCLDKSCMECFNSKQ